MEKELPRKMMQDTGNQKQFGMGIGDDRFGNSGSRKSGTGGWRQSVEHIACPAQKFADDSVEKKESSLGFEHMRGTAILPYLCYKRHSPGGASGRGQVSFKAESVQTTQMSESHPRNGSKK